MVYIIVMCLISLGGAFATLLVIFYDPQNLVIQNVFILLLSILTYTTALVLVIRLYRLIFKSPKVHTASVNPSGYS